MSFLSEHRRWWIVALLCGFTVGGYLDRQALSVLAPTLRRELGLTTVHYSYAASFFLAAYVLGYGFSGRILDRVGVKAGMTCALAVWMLAGMAHALAFGWVSLAACRILLGLGQSFTSPGGMKAIAEWIPKRERALCTAVFSNGNSLGAVLAPPVVAGLALYLGWRWAFVLTGACGIPLLIVWWRVYDAPDRHARLSDSERALILSGNGAPGPSDGAAAVLLGRFWKDRRCLAFFFARMLTDPISYFAAFWLPVYLQSARGLSLGGMARLGWIPYVASPLLGGPLGGACSDWLVRRGLRPKGARLRILAASALLMPVAAWAVRAESIGLTIALLTVMVAAQACWNTNILTLASEAVPRSQVASLVAVGGMGGGLGGIAMTLIAGRIIPSLGYRPVFTGIGCLSIIAFCVLSLFLHQAPQSAASH